jgi:hypothetical protein
MMTNSPTVRLGLIIAGSLIAGSPAYAQSASSPENVEAALATFASLTANGRAEFKKRLAVVEAKSTSRAATGVTPLAIDKSSTTPKGPAVLEEAVQPLHPVPFLAKRVQNNLYEDCYGLVPLLRKNWVDIGFASCPQTVAKATGAEISYSNDRAKQNAIWSINGTAALLYNTALSNSSYSSIGGYVTVNRETNSSVTEADSNTNTLAYGGLIEFGFVRETTKGIQYSDDYIFGNYFRLRGGAVEDHIKGTNAGSATFEWLPTFRGNGFHIHDAFNPIPGEPYLVRIDPALLIQYARIVGGSKPLAFNDMNQSLRVGPQITVGFYPGTSGDFLSHFVGSVTYHWAYETYSGRRLSWFDTSLTYNIDSDGYFGLTGTYQRGNDENTGVFANIYKISLTGKI